MLHDGTYTVSAVKDGYTIASSDAITLTAISSTEDADSLVNKNVEKNSGSNVTMQFVQYDGNGETVSYEHGPQLYDVYDYSSYKEISQGDSVYHPFCMVHFLTSSSAYKDTRTCQKADAYGNLMGVLGNLYAYYEDHSTNGSSVFYPQTNDKTFHNGKYWPDGDVYGKYLTRALFFGYPYNANGLLSNLSETDAYFVTQQVVFAIGQCGCGYEMAQELRLQATITVM